MLIHPGLAGSSREQPVPSRIPKNLPIWYEIYAIKYATTRPDHKEGVNRNPPSYLVAQISGLCARITEWLCCMCLRLRTSNARIDQWFLQSDHLEINHCGDGRVRQKPKHVPYSSCLLQLLFAYLDRSVGDAMKILVMWMRDPALLSLAVKGPYAK